MDPDEALYLIRRLTKEFDEVGEDDEAAAYVGSELVDAVSGLDEWLSRGGFLPEDWSHR